MSRPDRPSASTIYPNPSLPAALVALYRLHAARLPSLSGACAEGLRAALRAIGVDPPQDPPPARTAAATAARARRRAQGGT